MILSKKMAKHLAPFFLLLPLFVLFSLHCQNACGRLVIAADGKYSEFEAAIPPSPSFMKLNAKPVISVHSSPSNAAAIIAGGHSAMATKTTTMERAMEQKIANDSSSMKIEDNKEKRREDFMKKVQIIPTKDEHAEQLIQHWADQAFSSLFAAIAHKKLKQFKKPVHDEFGECSKQANTIALHAKCVSDLFQGKIDGKKYIDEAKKKASRFDRYRMKKRAEFRQKLNKEQKKATTLEEANDTIRAPQNSSSSRFGKYREKKSAEHIFRRDNYVPQKVMMGMAQGNNEDEWIGSFRMMRDSPIASSSSKANAKKQAKKSKSSIETTRLKVKYAKMKPSAHIWQLYQAHRRERRQTGIVKRKDGYELMTPTQGRLSPIGQIARTLMRNVLKAKGKGEADVVPWQQTVQRIQESATKRKEIKKRLGEDEVENMDQLTYRGLQRQGALEEEDLNEIAENPAKLRKFLDKKLKMDGKKEGGRAAGAVQRIVRLLRDGIKLGYAFAGENTTEMENKTLRMVSPRFLSITPEDSDNGTIDFISPSLFSIHGDGKGIENLTSIPSLMKNVGGPIGFSYQDQQMWLDFIMEASGVIENAKRIEDELNGTMAHGNGSSAGLRGELIGMDKEKYEREIRTKDGTPLYFTKQNISDGFAESEVKKVDIFEWIQRNITEKQVHEMNDSGYTLLSKEQLKLLYGLGSPYEDVELFNNFSSMDHDKVLDLIVQDIHTLAALKSLKLTPKDMAAPGQQQPFGGHRKKRQAIVLSPITFTSFVSQFIVGSPLILSPIIFSPLILSPVVLGPVILSPGLFVPLVLSPRLLSPGVLSPVAFVPFILSPIALNPFILNPGVFVPFVLSPFVLSPFILSPQVFTPLILSPLALSPFILNPAVASPLVLSPFVLTPIIYSPMFLSALVLSPYALSPVINSPLFAFSVILSPSYLS